jgi:hypothetical protein
MPQTRHVLILDQFVGPTPYNLQRWPIRFDQLVLAQTTKQHSGPWRAPEVKDVPEDFVPEMATTVYAEDKDGNAFAWKYRWDTSG